MDTTTTTTANPPSGARTRARLTTDQVWDVVERTSFAVLSHVTPGGQPRSSGVVHQAIDHRLYVAVGPDSFKARHVAADPHVAVTVPVRRGGLLALAMPIPPATVSFHGTAAVHLPGSAEADRIMPRLGRLLPEEHAGEVAVLEITPVDDFLLYGVGTPLLQMRDPKRARDRVPVA